MTNKEREIIIRKAIWNYKRAADEQPAADRRRC